MAIDSLEKLFHEELKDIYDAEKRLTKALPKMVKAAKSEELKAALQDHLEVTNTQVGRLEQVFQALGAKPTAKPCKAMQGLLAEGEEAMEEDGPEPFTDLGIIAAGRRVEHYEMAAYLSLQGLAEHLNLPDVEELLAANLEEENEADEALSELCESLIGSLGERETPSSAAPKAAGKKKAMTV